MKDIFKDCKSVQECEEELNKLIESWPVVVQLENNNNYGWYHRQEHLHYAFNRKAKLAFIEPIVKESCQHEAYARIGPREEPWFKGRAILSNGKIEVDSFECKHCGIELIAKWEEKK